MNTMSGPPPENTQNRNPTKDIAWPRIEIKISDPAGNETWAARLEGRDSTDDVTGTNVSK